MSNDSTKKTIQVALGVCLVCSVLVSIAAVELKPIQDENKQLDKLKNILIAGDLYEDGVDIKETYEKNIEPVMINLESGDIVEEEKFDDELNIKDFDIKTMAANDTYGQSISAENDLANIKRKPNDMVIYIVRSGEKIEKYIFPVYGAALWSTMYGFLALDSNFGTVRGITFYEHGETPGLGGEIDNPKWQKIWNGKNVFDEDGNLRLEVIKGQVDATSNNAKYQIDGLSGSTLTTRGVDNMVKYWLSDNGYGPFISKMKGSEL